MQDTGTSVKNCLGIERLLTFTASNRLVENRKRTMHGFTITEKYQALLPMHLVQLNGRV